MTLKLATELATIFMTYIRQVFCRPLWTYKLPSPVVGRVVGNRCILFIGKKAEVADRNAAVEFSENYGNIVYIFIAFVAVLNRGFFRCRGKLPPGSRRYTCTGKRDVCFPRVIHYRHFSIPIPRCAPPSLHV